MGRIAPTVHRKGMGRGGPLGEGSAGRRAYKEGGGAPGGAPCLRRYTVRWEAGPGAGARGGASLGRVPNRGRARNCPHISNLKERMAWKAGWAGAALTLWACNVGPKEGRRRRARKGVDL